MLHHILVRFTPDAGDHAALESRIRVLFAGALAVPGVSAVRVIPSCVSLPNRHDLMIVMELTREGLAAFDASPIHARWKAGFGPVIAQKTIFDCE